MTRALAHRGPDQEGLEVLPGCVLGHRRLSIIDLTTGSQPMLGPQGKTAVVFNGEIYGYQELRKETPYDYQTESDTEVLLALYAQHQEAMVPRVRGMFAFALWDVERRRLVGARDRFGEKPLFYAWGPKKEFLFASEIKALLASGLLTGELCPHAMAYYLQRQFVPPWSTIYREIECLPPAHHFTLTAGKLECSPYWKLPEPGPKLGLEESAERFRELLTASVRRQLIADVPVGAFLSGGLDSSTVVTVASQIRPDLATFAFGFGARSELPFARAVARKNSTQHLEVEEKPVNWKDLFWRMQEVYDQPFGDTSNIPTFLIAEEARKHMKVILTGDGADELLGGYTPWYQPLFHHRRLREMPMGAPGLLYTLFRILKKLKIPLHPDHLGHVAAYPVFRQGAPTVLEAHWRNQSLFAPEELRNLGLAPPPRPDLTPDKDCLDDALRFDLQDYMPGDILVKTDRAAMAHGLELRAPFLDTDLASFCISLPSTLKINSRRDKELLRRAYETDWPESIRDRRKQGFTTPVKRLLEAPGMTSLTRDLLEDPSAKIFDWIDHQSCQKILPRENQQTWNLLVLSAWLESRARIPLAGME
jgi:asparagine synthase (glutamine-hydrolysing)